MKVELIVIGKTDVTPVAELVDMYQKRINFHVRFGVVVLPEARTAKKLSAAGQNRLEGEAILKYTADADQVILLDERGDAMRSVDFARWLQKRMNVSSRRICFVIGGPYGFSEEVYKRADAMISLSSMTFSHQIVRAIFAEQLYRAFTILAGDPYHHE